MSIIVFTHKSFAVRRAVKIFRDILLSNPSYGGRATAMHAMLQRADDRKEDDGVRDLVHETFHTLWFNGTVSRLKPTKFQVLINSHTSTYNMTFHFTLLGF